MATFAGETDVDVAWWDGTTETPILFDAPGGPAVNLISNPTGGDTLGTILLGENLAMDPRFTGTVWSDYASAPTWGVPGNYGVTLHRTATPSFAGVRTKPGVVSIPAGTYTFSLDVDATAVGAADLFRMELSGGRGLKDQAVTVGSQRISATVPITATNQMIYLQFLNPGGTAGDLAGSLDRLIISATGSQEFFDGDNSPDPDFTAAWTGLPHSSSSTLTAPNPVGWSGAYYSNTRQMLAPLPGETPSFMVPNTTGTLLIDDGTSVTRTPHTGTTVTVPGVPYFRAAFVAGDYQGGFPDGSPSSLVTTIYTG